MNSVFFKEHNFEETSVGKFPKDWEVVMLGDVAKVKGGKRLPKGEKFADFDTGFPYIRVVDFRNGTVDMSNLKYLIPETQKRIRNYIISSNDVYISIAGTIGLAGVIPPELDGANLTENAAKLCNLERVEKKFLAYLLNSEVLRKQISGLTGKGTQPKLALFRIESLKLPLPPIKEQKTLAEVLGVVDSAIELADKVIAKTERLKKGLMQHLLTRGIGHTEYKDTLIGKTPKTWQTVKLEDVSDDFIGGGTPSTSNSEYWNGDIAWMTSAHISGRLITAGQKYITKKGVEGSATHIVPKNNLLVATRVGIGKVAINKIDIAISQDLTGVTINKEKALPEFLYWVLRNSRHKLSSLAQGSTIKGILREDLGRLSIPLPSLPEQKKIDEILSTVDKKLELDREERTRLESVKRGLMDLFLTGKVRVKVV